MATLFEVVAASYSNQVDLLQESYDLGSYMYVHIKIMHISQRIYDQYCNSLYAHNVYHISETRSRLLMVVRMAPWRPQFHKDLIQSEMLGFSFSGKRSVGLHSNIKLIVSKGLRRFLIDKASDPWLGISQSKQGSSIRLLALKFRNPMNILYNGNYDSIEYHCKQLLSELQTR